MKPWKGPLSTLKNKSENLLLSVDLIYERGFPNTLVEKIEIDCSKNNFLFQGKKKTEKCLSLRIF